MDFRVILFHNRLRHPFQVFSGLISNRPAMASIKPVFPSNTSLGPVIPRMVRKAAWVAPNAVLG